MSSRIVSFLALLAAFSLRVLSEKSAKHVSPSSNVVSQLKLYSQYSAAAYCVTKANTTSSSELLQCAGNSCPMVKSAGAILLGAFNNLAPYDTTGYVAADPSKKVIVLAFRGAADTGYLTVVEQLLRPCAAVCPRCKCNYGFYQSWVSAREIVKSFVTSAMRKYPDYSLVVTGHSLGATQAAFAAAEFRQNGTSDARLYTYGQPRVGDLKMSRHVSLQKRNYRVTHTDDPAPRIGSTNIGLRHISPEYWIYRDIDDFTVRPGDVQILEGYNNFSGNAGTGGFDEPAHVQYLQSDIAACFAPSHL